MPAVPPIGETNEAKASSPDQPVGAYLPRLPASFAETGATQITFGTLPARTQIIKQQFMGLGGLARLLHIGDRKNYFNGFAKKADYCHGRSP